MHSKMCNLGIFVWSDNRIFISNRKTHFALGSGSKFSFKHEAYSRSLKDPFSGRRESESYIWLERNWS